MPAFDDLFSIPRGPRIGFAPGMYEDFPLPAGLRAVVTDLYAENQGGGDAVLEVSQVPAVGAAEVRYTFTVPKGGRLALSLTTGLRLGEEAPAAAVRVGNWHASAATLLVRVNGYVV